LASNSIVQTPAGQYFSGKSNSIINLNLHNLDLSL
jgi:hypothetical protein